MSLSSKNDTTFRYPLDVRFFEVDSLGVVFNMWYLGWCDEAMSAFMESMGYGYATLRAQGMDAVLRKAELEWLDSLQAFQHAEVTVSVDHVGTTSFRLAYDIERVETHGAETHGAETVGAETVGAETVGAETVDRGRVQSAEALEQGRTRCARALITYVCVQIEDRNKARIPADLREALSKNHA